MIGEVLTRCKQIKGVDEVVCAIPRTDAELGLEAEKYCRVTYGARHDVLLRYVNAAKFLCGADLIMRITADCPHLSPELCSAVLKLAKKSGADYTSNIMPRTFPKGLDCEVFTRAALQWADQNSMKADREHVTLVLQRSPYISRQNLTSPWPMDGRLTLDTEDDYKVICAAFGCEPRPTPSFLDPHGVGWPACAHLADELNQRL